MAFGRVKSVARRFIGRNRRSGPVKFLHGFASFVDSAYSNEGSSLALNGELRVIQSLRQMDFKVAFDVGANQGDWLMAALADWPSCQVHAFEVAQPTFEQLELRVRQSGKASRVTLNDFGLSDSTGVRQMYYFPEHPDLTCDLKRHENYEVVPFDARLVRGDDYCGERHLDAVDFLKIDVEGAEYRVLKGLCSRLHESKIYCVQFEYGAFSTQTRVLLADYYALLSDGYWIGKIYPTYVDFRDYEWTMEDFRFANYCCVSKTRPELREVLAAG
jgi:FkbM family methyltransferase